ncbi:substrate-binding domain-containing protein [Paenibacillus sp. GCM10027626]|uniref:substrate-binding domain-containing protein n=1 Tax=Paenibacillus sp. GCM10027626 TaxID=3273411 RepID=UPI0036273011
MKGKKIGHMPLYVKIANTVTEKIRTGQLKSGEKIVEEELQQQFEVSPITTKKALTLLAEQQLISRVPGKGTFVSDTADLSKQVNVDADKTVVFLFPMTDGGDNALCRSYHLTEILAGVAHECRRHGYKLAVQDTENEQAKENILLYAHKKSNVEGIIIYPSNHEFFSEELMRSKLENFPFVIVDQYYPQIDTYCVMSDHKLVTYEATRHLIEQGHQHIGLIMDIEMNSLNIRARIDGYKECLTDHGFPISKEYIFDSTDKTGHIPKDKEDIILQEMTAFMRNYPEITAYLSSSSLFIQAAHRLNRTIGEDISVVFIDDSHQAEYHSVSVTAIRQQNRRIGEIAVQMLANPNSFEDKQVVLKPDLIIRNSVAKLS